MPHRWPKMDLQAKFNSVMLPIAALLLLAVTASTYVLGRSSVEQQGRQSVQGALQAVERTAAIGLYALDTVLMKEVLDGLMRHSLVLGASIEFEAGKRRVSSSRVPLEQLRGDGPGHLRMALRSPFDPSEVLGELHVWVNQEMLQSQAESQALIIAGGLFAVLATITATFGLLSNRVLSSPMRDLAAQLAAMQPGTKQLLTLDGGHEHDELGTIVQAANKLLLAQHAALERERQALAEVAALEARYREIFDTTSAGIFVLSAQGLLIAANPAIARMLGADDAAMKLLRSEDFAQRVFNNREGWDALLSQARDHKETAGADLELRRFDGSSSWVHCLVSVQPSAAGDAQERLIEGVVYDVTQRRSAELLARTRADTDALTGLHSRAFFESNLAQRIELARSASTSLSLLFIDLDGFKQVNDSLGHTAGDAVLVKSAQRLRACLRRGTDLAGRLGGDELVLMLDGAAATDASVQELAQRVLHQLAEPVRLKNGQEARVGASIGIASFPLHARSAQSLMRAADQAMYVAKHSGKGRFHVAADSDASFEDSAMQGLA